MRRGGCGGDIRRDGSAKRGVVMVEGRWIFRMRTLLVAIGVVAVALAVVSEPGRIHERSRRERAARVLATIRKVEARIPGGTSNPKEVCGVIGDRFEIQYGDPDMEWVDWSATFVGDAEFSRATVYRFRRMSPRHQFLALTVRPGVATTPDEIQALLSPSDGSSRGPLAHFDEENKDAISFDRPWGNVCIWLAHGETGSRELEKVILTFREH
jgi:hypothetical protein